MDWGGIAWEVQRGEIAVAVVVSRALEEGERYVFICVVNGLVHWLFWLEIIMMEGVGLDGGGGGDDWMDGWEDGLLDEWVDG